MFVCSHNCYISMCDNFLSPALSESSLVTVGPRFFRQKKSESPTTFQCFLIGPKGATTGNGAINDDFQASSTGKFGESQPAEAAKKNVKVVICS